MAAMIEGKRIELRECHDFESVRRLALASGLEDGPFDDIVACYGMYADDQLVGCGTLKQRGDVFSVEWLAVAQEWRGKGLGSWIVARLEEEARARKAKKLWALARAPGFFLKIGFRRAEEGEGDGPTTKSCLACRQYKRSCFPAVVCKDL